MAGDYTALKKMGAKWRGLSPFQNEKSPSFYVDGDKQLFYCFSTGQGGDIFNLVMLKDGLTFPEAMERVATRFGVALEYEAGAGASPDDRSKRGKLLDLHEVVTAHFHTCFKAATPHAAAVRAYWTARRQFTLETADEYRIGFAPADGGDLASFLLKKGFDKSILGASGLFVGMD
jgi:DNA primase